MSLKDEIQPWMRYKREPKHKDFSVPMMILISLGIVILLSFNGFNV